jgi:hypothetical protein
MASATSSSRIAEQMAILIKSHGGAGVAKHLLDDLHVGAGCDGQRAGA